MATRESEIQGGNGVRDNRIIEMISCDLIRSSDRNDVYRVVVSTYDEEGVAVESVREISIDKYELINSPRNVAGLDGSTYLGIEREKITRLIVSWLGRAS